MFKKYFDFNFPFGSLRARFLAENLNRNPPRRRVWKKSERLARTAK